MIYRFGDLCLDTRKHELRAAGAVVALEPQVFALLTLLIEHRDRLVGKEEIIDKIWNGRIVSEAAVASRIKTARQAIGDDGQSQSLIRTVPKVGFRFVGEVQTELDLVVAAPAEEPEAPKQPRTRPSIAILPFQSMSGPDTAAPTVAKALPHDLITELSRLRWLLVIARGSSFRFDGPAVDHERIRTELNARYCLSGLVEVTGASLMLSVELSDTQDQSVVWSERFQVPLDGTHEVRERIVRAVVSALELHIPAREAQQARLKSPENLDAWSAYHLGLNQMFRFSADGNEKAAALFARAIALEPGFARAYAGLSFTRFEDAFLNFAADRPRAVGDAVRFAERALEEDALDPFCNLVMGRTHWLAGDLDASLGWLDRAIQLNPNYAQAKYSRAWTETLLGEAVSGQENIASALELSPLDPLLYGMLGVRAMSYMVLDDPAQAAAWGERAARAPGAHALIEVISAVGHSLNGDAERARHWAHSARRRAPALDTKTFMAAFPFQDGAAKTRIQRALAGLGL